MKRETEAREAAEKAYPIWSNKFKDKDEYLPEEIAMRERAAFISGWNARSLGCGLRWVKASERLPTEFGDYVARMKDRYGLIKVKMTEWEPNSESHYSYWTNGVIEWLSESESTDNREWPGSDEIEDVWASHAHSLGSFGTWKAAIQWLRERMGK